MYCSKKNNLIISSVLLLAIIFVSCKKETKENTNCCCPIVTPTTPTPYQKPLGLMDGNGFFVFQKFYTVLSNTITLDSTSSYVKQIYKSDSPENYYYNIQYASIFIDSVKINNVKLKSIANTFVDSTFNQFSPPRICTLYADTTYYDLINYTDNNLFPEYTGFNLLPDSVYYNSNFTVNVGNRTNAKETEVLILYKNYSSLITTNYLDNSANSFMIPSDNLPYDWHKDKVSIRISLKNWSSIKLNNRDYYFITECIYNKP